MKRKREGPKVEESSEKPSKAENNKKSFVDIELHLETPLPLEWQRCLDLQSGKIHFYNIKTHKRTSRDPRRSPEPPSSPVDEPLSLDLELNLNCQSMRKDQHVGISHESKRGPIVGFRADDLASFGDRSIAMMMQSRPSEEAAEMVARVCMQCNLPVMLLKSSPVCPNCKFMHPTDLQSHPMTLFIASHPIPTKVKASL